MKVVLFCGGFGTRLRDYASTIPKPMVSIGPRPILWHIMKYYAHFGHKDFILCLGWQANVIKDYFLSYDECVSNNFVLSGESRAITLLNEDIHDWRITFVDTGNGASVGERLKRVQPLLANEPTFLANYSDGLSDLHLPDLIHYHHAMDSVVSFVAVKPRLSFHTVGMSQSGCVTAIQAISESDTWINGGFFVMSQDVFGYLEDGEDLVPTPLSRMMHDDRLHAMRYRGFWSCMDTYKEKQTLDEMYKRGDTPWQVWDSTSASPSFRDELPTRSLARRQL